VDSRDVTNPEPSPSPWSPPSRSGLGTRCCPRRRGPLPHGRGSERGVVPVAVVPSLTVGARNEVLSPSPWSPPSRSGLGTRCCPRRRGPLPHGRGSERGAGAGAVVPSLTVGARNEELAPSLSSHGRLRSGFPPEKSWRAGPAPGGPRPGRFPVRAGRGRRCRPLPEVHRGTRYAAFTRRFLLLASPPGSFQATKPAC
jgi:hypothetical protein